MGKAKAICKPLGLSVRGTGGEHTPIGADGTCDISPSARFCITEAEIITALYNGLKLLKEEEAKAAVKDEMPVVEEKKDEAPVEEEKKDETPTVDEKKEDEPTEEGKKDEAPVEEEKKDETPTVDEKKEDEPTEEE